MDGNLDAEKVIRYPFPGHALSRSGFPADGRSSAFASRTIHQTILDRIRARRDQQIADGLTPAHDDAVTAFDLVGILEDHMAAIRDAVELGDGEETLCGLVELAATAMRFMEWTLQPEPDSPTPL
jgi:hypothetical protein